MSQHAPISRLFFAAALLLSIGALDADARDVVIKRKDGRTLRGELLDESTTEVTIRIGGIPAKISRLDIEDLQYLKTLDEEYKERKAAVKTSDFDGRYGLADWLFKQYEDPQVRSVEALKLARVEVDALLKDKPDHTRAKLLKTVIEQRLKIEAEKKPDIVEPTPTPEPGPADNLPPSSPSELLTKEDLNLMRVYEVSLKADPAPRITIPKEVEQELFDKYREEPAVRDYLGRQGEAKFRKLSGAEKLGVLFDARARDLYPKVIVNDEPPVLQQFKTRVHPNYVVRYCGVCHTGPQAVGLRLVSGRPTDEQVAYTNLLILRRTQSGGMPLINTTAPIRSRLIQYGLPPEAATAAHPNVPGWKRFFLDRDDARLKEIVTWIASLYGEGEDYPIKYTLPAALKPTKEPAPDKPEGDTPPADAPPPPPQAPDAPPPPAAPQTK